MTRRIVRTMCQVAAASVFTFIVVFFLDRNFRVLPDALHEYMPSHHAGSVVTDITIAQCSRLNLFSSCRLDPENWHRIEKDLYLGKAVVSKAYVHVRRRKEEELTAGDKVVLDITVGRLDPGVAEEGQGPKARGSNKDGGGDRWESRPGGIWIKRSSKLHASDDKKAVTSVDLLFGDDAVEARDGWAITGTPLLIDSGSNIPAAHLTVRRGSPREPVKPRPRINDNGKFKIMQLADLHLSTGTGICRDSLPEDYGDCEADTRTLDFVSRIIEDEKPDLVVLSGDQINGDTSPDAPSAIFKFAQLLIKHKLPYVCIFGNHDDEGSLSRSSQMSLIETLPYSLSLAGPDDIDGVGNYYVEVLAPGKSSQSALTLYLLDSHSYSPDERKWKGYDWIKKNQIEWFRQTAQSLKRKHKDYSHIHLEVAFIHIPLPEYCQFNQFWRGPFREPPTAPLFNSGFRDALVEQGVVMVSCGHDHVNEYCALSLEDMDEEGTTQRPALWMCYGGATGFGGYAGYGGYHRKIRLFEFDMNMGRITTWKRSEWGNDTEIRLDEQLVVDAGHPVFPPEGEEPPHYDESLFLPPQ